MSKFVTKNNRKTFVATASCFFAGKMRTSALALADKYEGKVEEIKIDEQPRYKFIFDEIENRDKFVASFDRAYAKAHKKNSSSPKKKTAPKKKVAEGKGNTKMMKELNKLAGMGKSANKQAAAIIRKYGLEPNGEVWEAWKSIR